MLIAITFQENQFVYLEGEIGVLEVEKKLMTN